MLENSKTSRICVKFGAFKGDYEIEEGQKICVRDIVEATKEDTQVDSDREYIVLIDGVEANMDTIVTSSTQKIELVVASGSKA